MKKKMPKHIEMGLVDKHIITLNLDGTSTHNIHLSDGFERSFDRFVDILNEYFDVSVKKEGFGLETSYFLKKGGSK